jgi:HAMP domain-containing protein
MRALRQLATPGGLLVLALVAGLAVLAALAFAQQRETQRLEDELAEQRRELAELRREREPSDPLSGLLGGGGNGDLGGGGLGELLGGQSGDLLRCAAPSGEAGGDPQLDPGKLLEGLLDPGGGDGQAGPADPKAEIRRLARQVERLRGLRFKRPVDAELLDDNEIDARVAELFRSEYPRERAELEGRILAALGAVPPGSDLYELRLGALQSQVAGLYVPQTGELLVRGGGELDSLERLVLVHELEHALADQALDLPVPERPDPERADSEAARLALVEGDATLTMQRYSLGSLDFSNLMELVGQAGTLLQSQEDLERLPHYLRQELTFPYLTGLSFVCDRYIDGGWEAVDRAYAAPPAGTDQLMFPERYGEKRKGEPAELGELDEPWSRRLASEFGAAPLRWLLEAPGGDPDAALPGSERATAAWGGGRLELWTDGEDTALGLALRQRPGEEGLCEAVARWYESAFPDAQPADTEDGEQLASDGPRQDAVLRCDGGEVMLGIAPDLASAREVAG